MTGQEKAILAMIVDGALKKLPTADLQAELKRRSPCLSCGTRATNHCHACDWLYVNSIGIKPDLFSSRTK